MAHPGGRPTDYNEEISKEICRLVSSTPVGLNRLCKRYPHLPNPGTIHDWRNDHIEFAKQYALAKAAQIECLIDEIIDIADDSSNDLMVNEQGKEVVNTEHINRCRLKIDSRKWLASKLAPKIYGDKLHSTHDVTVKQEDAIRELA